MEFDKLTINLYDTNINWINVILSELEKHEIENPQKFTTDPYIYNSMIVLGYYFMNLYVVSNINNYEEDNATYIMNSIINGVSNYNFSELKKKYNQDIDLNKIVNEYNQIVNKTKQHAAKDGLKARVVATDQVYRSIYKVFNKRHFNAFIRIVLTTFNEYEKNIQKVIDQNIKKR